MWRKWRSSTLLRYALTGGVWDILSSQKSKGEFWNFNRDYLKFSNVTSDWLIDFSCVTANETSKLILIYKTRAAHYRHEPMRVNTRAAHHSLECVCTFQFVFTLCVCISVCVIPRQECIIFTFLYLDKILVMCVLHCYDTFWHKKNAKIW